MDTAIKSKATGSRRWRIALGLAAVLLAAGGVRLFWPSAQATIAPIQVQAGFLDESVPINAVLTPSRVGAVATIRGGTVAEVIAFGGQAVKAGDPLLKLSNDDLERQLVEAQSELAGAQSELVSQQAASADEVDSLAVARVKAGNALQVADMQMEAERKLQERGIISLLSLKKTEAEREGKRVDLEYASHHALQARSANRAKVAAATERAEVLRSRTAGLKASVDALTLRAPFDGVVSKVDGKPGATIAPGTQLAEVITADMRIDLEVSEQFANAIHPGQLLRLQGGLTGKVLSMSPASDGGVVKGRAAIDGDTSKLRSNTTLPGEAVLATHGEGLFILIEGVDIANRTMSATVQTTQGQTETRSVRFGPRYRQKVVVVEGASAGESIVGLDAGPTG